MKSKSVVESRKRLRALMSKVRSEVGDEAVDKHLARNKIVSDVSNCSVIFLLDVSLSMASNRKLESSKAGLISFAADLARRHQTGLITFSDSERMIKRLSSDTIDGYLTGVNIEGGTMLSAAIALAREELGRVPSGRKVIVLVTDGFPGDRKQASVEADLAKSRGIEILAIATADADKAFLDALVSSKEFSVVVADDRLKIGIQRAAELLALPKL